MATSSIFANVIITNEEIVKSIVDAYETSLPQKDSHYDPSPSLVTDPNEIKRLVSLWKGNKQ